MSKYRVELEYWSTDGVFDPTKYDFWEWALYNPNGCDASEVIGEFDTLEEALAKLSQYKCSYKALENYNRTDFELYEVDELIYDDNGDIEDMRFIQNADVEM